MYKTKEIPYRKFLKKRLSVADSLQEEFVNYYYLELKKIFKAI
jgi:hypothetical protein